jgi:hypothetical protein
VKGLDALKEYDFKGIITIDNGRICQTVLYLVFTQSEPLIVRIIYDAADGGRTSGLIRGIRGAMRLQAAYQKWRVDVEGGSVKCRIRKE